MQGMALLNVLVAVSVLGIVFAAALPAALSLYARAAVEYEAVRLVAEIRRVQAISRVTAMEQPKMARISKIPATGDDVVAMKFALAGESVSSSS